MQPGAQPLRIDQDPATANRARSSVREAWADFKVWQIIRRHKWRVVLAFSAVIGLAITYAVLTGPWCESTAQVLVRKKHLETAPISGPNMAQPTEDYLATHILLITSPRIAKQAVANQNLSTLGIFQKSDPLASVIDAPSRYFLGEKPKGSKEDAVANRIVQSLRASSDVAKPGTPPSHEVLTVSIQGSVDQDCDKVLEAVIASYQDFLKETYQDVNAETLALITRARDVLQQEIETKEAAYRDFRRDTPLVGKGKDGITVQQDRLFHLDSRRSALRVRQAEISASLQAIEKARGEGRSNAYILSLVAGLPANQEILAPTFFPNTDAQMTGRTPLVTLEEELIRLKLEEKALLKSYGPAHPEVQSIQNKIRDVSELITPSPAAGDSGTKPTIWDENLVNLKVRLLQQELAANERTDKKLQELFEHDQLDAKASIVHEIEDETHREGIKRSEQLYDSIVSRLHEIDSVRDYRGFDTQIIAAPKSGLNKKKYAIVFLAALLAGLMAGFGWACLAEFRDKSFRTSREIRDQFGVPVMGHIPVFHRSPGRLPAPESNGYALAPSLCTYHQANSYEAEAYLAVRVALTHSVLGGDCRVIQITSPTHGEGKTTLTANLGVSIAQSGQRVVLVDADLRRPGLAELFGLSQKIGLTSVLAGEADLAAAIQPTSVPGLFILGSGPLSASPAETVASPRLRQLFDALRQQCDYVLVDSPPLLAVPDPRVVAHSVDGVLLTLRNSKQCRVLTQSAGEILDAAGAKILGVVVNGISRQASSASYAYPPLSGSGSLPRLQAIPTS
jgi:capsular exopolysaccharide synthesis family protein